MKQYKLDEMTYDEIQELSIIGALGLGIGFFGVISLIWSHMLQNYLYIIIGLILIILSIYIWKKTDGVGLGEN